MDYDLLAQELLGSMVEAARHPFHRDPAEFARGELNILNCLYFSREGVSSGQLSALVGLGSGRMADALKSLEAKQLVARQNDTADRRRVMVYITEQGRVLVDHKKALLLKRMRDMLAELGEEDAAEFVRLMGRVVQISSPDVRND